MAFASIQKRIVVAPDQEIWRAGALALLYGGVLAAAAFVAYSGRAEFGDEGSFCTIAQGVLRGQLPYRDLFNEKPPLQYFWTAAVMALGGSTLSGARIAAGIVMALTAGAIVLGPLKRRAGPLTVIGVMLATAAIAIGLDAYRNTADSSLALFYALSAILLSRRPWKSGPTMALGALHGVALGFRQTAAASALVIFLSPDAKGRRAAFAGGMLAGWLVWIVPLALAGLLGDFLNATLLFHVGNAGASKYISHQFDHGVGILVWAFLLTAVAVAAPRERGRRYWLLGWLVVAALAFFGRQEAFRLWPSASAALALLAWGDGAEATTLIASVAPAKRWRPLGFTATAAIVAAAGVVLAAPPRHPPVEALAEALRRMTSPADEVWAGPFSPYVYCLSERRPASRYYFVLPWTAKAEVGSQIATDILTRRPVVVVDRSIRAFDLDVLAPDVGPILAAHYRSAVPEGRASVGHFVIYRPIQP